jgi:hypothetical protein
MGYVQQVEDPWFAAHPKTFYSDNVKFYVVDGLCGRQSTATVFQPPKVYFYFLVAHIFFMTHIFVGE